MVLRTVVRGREKLRTSRNKHQMVLRTLVSCVGEKIRTYCADNFGEREDMSNITNTTNVVSLIEKDGRSASCVGNCGTFFQISEYRLGHISEAT